MARPIRHQAAIISQLLSSAECFNFFQAVQLLKRAAWKIDFKSTAGFTWAHSDLVQIEPLNEQHVALSTSVLNLLGADSILPEYIVEQVAQRLVHKDASLKDYLDIFQHRLLELLYEFWEKTQLQPQDIATQPSQRLLLQLTGLYQHPHYSQEMLLHYGGILIQATHSQSGLEHILSEQFQVPIHISAFEGEWLTLPNSQMTRLGRGGQFQRLGQDSLIGRRIWQVQHRFAVRIHAPDFKHFMQFLPNGDWLRVLSQWIKAYVGIEFSFTIELLVEGVCVPYCVLNTAQPLQLGWTSWLKTTRAPQGLTIVRASPTRAQL